MPGILITVPNKHWMHATVSQRLILLSKETRYPVTIQFPSAVPLENNQHGIIQTLLNGDWSHWLSIDADNPPTNNPLDLVELGKDIIGFPTPVWHYTGQPGERPIYFNAYRWKDEKNAYVEWQPQEGIQKVDAIGGGCFLVHRRVFEHPDMVAPFTRGLKPDGTVEFGNDMMFCQRARKAGFDIWAAFEYEGRSYCCDHFVEISLLECVRAIKGMRSS